MLGWALRASSKLLFFNTRTSSSSAISARLATASVQTSNNFHIIVEFVLCSFFRLVRKAIATSWPEKQRSVLGGVFCWSEAGRVAAILCVPLLTWHCNAGTGGVSCGAHAPLWDRKQFVLKCDWTAAVCTWKWITAALRPYTSAAPSGNNTRFPAGGSLRGKRWKCAHLTIRHRFLGLALRLSPHLLCFFCLFK